MWFPGAEQFLPVYSSQHAYFTAHIHLGFFPITQPPRYFVLDNADFPQLWDLRSNFAATAKFGICSSPDDTWGYCRVGAALSTDGCWRWPFDLAAELMQDPSLPSSSYLCYSSLSQHWLSSCVANSTPKVLTPPDATLVLVAACIVLNPSFTLWPFWAMHILKAPTAPLLAHAISGGWGGHFTLCCYLPGKIIDFMNFPLPNFETSSYFHLSRSVYYFSKNYESYTFFLTISFFQTSLFRQTKLITEILR